jgi:beta-glucosidase
MYNRGLFFQVNKLIMSSRLHKLTAMFSILFVAWILMSQGNTDHVISYTNTISVNAHGESIQFPFNNPGLQWNARVDDLVGRLTLDEITAQMARGGRKTCAPGISRLGIKPYPWGSECLRGDVKAGPATSFPQAIGLSATFR